MSVSLNNNNNFINLFVEKNHNTTYLSTLLVTLFYRSSYNETLLSTTPKNYSHIYLQECIKTLFFSPLKNNMYIPQKNLDIIRNILNLVKILPDNNIMTEYTINILYNDLIHCLNFQQFTNKSECFEPIVYDINKKKEHYEPFIMHNINTKQIVNDWSMNYKNNLINIPRIICISIVGRKYNKNVSIDIKCKIQINNIQFLSGIKWSIRSIICCNNNKYSSYLLFPDNIWYMYNEQNIPCITKINLSDHESTIKEFSVLIFYEYKQTEW